PLALGPCARCSTASASTRGDPHRPDASSARPNIGARESAGVEFARPGPTARRSCGPPLWAAPARPPTLRAFAAEGSTMTSRTRVDRAPAGAAGPAPASEPSPGAAVDRDPLRLDVDGLAYALDRPPSKAGTKVVASVALAGSSAA